MRLQSTGAFVPILLRGAGLLLPLGIVGAQQTAPARHAFTPADWYKVTTVGAPALSPDGNKVAFTVTTVRESENKRHSEVWVVNTQGGEPVRYTSPGFESSAPRFADDGKTLYFTSQRAGGRGTNWALRMDMPSGEAFQPDRAPRFQQGSQPADKSFSITTGDSASGGRGGRGGGGGARGGRGGAPGESDSSATNANDPFGHMLPMARPPYDAITKPENPARFDGKQITQMVYKANGQGMLPGPSTAPRAPQQPVPAQIYLERDGSPRKQLTNTKYSHRDVSVSPDGKWIAFVADATLRADSVVTAERDSVAKLAPDRKRDEMLRNDTEIFILPVAGCEAQSAECTPRKIEYAGSEAQVVWSPDSRQIAFVGQPGRFKNQRLFVVSAGGGKPQDILGTWQYEPGTIQWLKNGSIAMQTSTGGARGLYAIDPATKKITTLLGGRRVVNNATFDASQSHVVFVATDMTHPTELFVANADGTGERKLTSFNDKVNADVAWSDAEEFKYKSVGNMEVEGWLMKPYGYDASKKYPLVLYIHGGPHSDYNEGWFDEFQSIAGAGMWVLFTNPRGSSGTNTEFTYASRGDWGGKDFDDIMKATDIAAKRADVDSTKMGVTGGSYGGFMTAWVTTKTNRFKAAETDRMISEWTFWYGASDAQGLTEGEFFGKPWENQIMYDTLSPIRYVKKVKTPTLLVQSEEDFRTPIGNAELWFMALKKQGVPAEFVRYPRSNHDLSRTGEPWLLVDRLSRLRQWFHFWLIDKPAGATAATTSNSR
ncbi:MAG: WD40-like beta Propeller containing protein [Gemmatimonadetes bacterium]|nr:WD40-like beta Propeller containing protein [Gemmatimonadota bacterium]